MCRMTSAQTVGGGANASIDQVHLVPPIAAGRVVPLGECERLGEQEAATARQIGALRARLGALQQELSKDQNNMRNFRRKCSALPNF